MILFISEEYGCRDWIAELTEDEYKDLIRRWETMKGLNCTVPVQLIIPQAVLLDDFRKKEPKYDKYCHIHECTDSRITDSKYSIPEDHEYFWLDGKKYTHMDLYDINDTLNSTQ